MFSVKDPVPVGLRSRVVYKFACAGVVYTESAEGRFSRAKNSGPHCSSGHYLTLEKLPSADSVYTT